MLSPVKIHLVWIRREICIDHAPFTRENSPVFSSVRAQQGMDFFTEGSIIMDFSLHRFFFFTRDKTAIDGLNLCAFLVNYCNAFISCLNSHSDGTRLLQNKWCNATFLQIFSDEVSNSSTSWIGNVHFWVNYSFNKRLGLITLFLFRIDHVLMHHLLLLLQ